ncbi:MAG: terminase small subunit, partial [Anaerovoracaceae bacterium]
GVKKEIERLKKNRLNRALLSEEDIFQRYMDIAFADITDYVEFGRAEQQVMGAFGPVFEKNEETGEKIPVTVTVNEVRFKESGDVDGTLIQEVSQGRNGAKIKLADRMKAIDWLANHMDLATAEQRARIENLQASTAKIRGEDPDGDEEDSGFIEALKGAAAEAWEED